jgi:hypothetical protein
MKIKKEIIINDEPMISTSTGIRKAVLTYTGPRYLYLEYDQIDKVVQVVMHISEIPDLETAKEKLTQIEGRVISTIDAEENIIAAAYFWTNYSLEVENYTETLPNGEVYTFEYSTDPNIGEIFDFLKMQWNVEKNDFDEYKFITNPVSDLEIIESINLISGKVSTALVENTSLSDTERTEIQTYIAKLTEFKSNVEQGSEHWKMSFPICNIPY